MVNKLPKLKEIIHQYYYAWYFWDENWEVRHGPYETREQAQKALDEYSDAFGKQINEREVSRCYGK